MVDKQKQYETRKGRVNTIKVSKYVTVSDSIRWSQLKEEKVNMVNDGKL